MKYRGVVYDVGLNFNGAGFSVEPFDPALVKYDLKTIAHKVVSQCRPDRRTGDYSAGDCRTVSALG
ncbi:hypothetical protein N7465_000465 [Penicillium sp. CMV-2018d]|nr:hypothetical protein N7465_000465 [Penicillium sp. CMV-2018d]